jgi:hypothetical protein
VFDDTLAATAPPSARVSEPAAASQPRQPEASTVDLMPTMWRKAYWETVNLVENCTGERYGVSDDYQRMLEGFVGSAHHRELRARLLASVEGSRRQIDRPSARLCYALWIDSDEWYLDEHENVFRRDPGGDVLIRCGPSATRRAWVLNADGSRGPDCP